LISHKYLNHGTLIMSISVPSKKCSDVLFGDNLPINMFIRNYSSLPATDPQENQRFYDDIYTDKKLIIKENKGRSGIYLWTNKITGDIYVGQSPNLALRFINYFNSSYLKSKESLIISRALIKYGYSNFSLTILEYCEKSELQAREQFYLGSLGPVYNILKTAGSSSGHTLSEGTKAKISQALKGVHVGDKSPWFGKTFSEETKQRMSLEKTGENNPWFGKTHSEETKNLMRDKALGRKHSEDTKLKMSAVRGNFLNIYEKCDKEGFKLIGSFVSARRAGKFLGMSGSTVNRYVNSGAIFKDRYKFSTK